MLGVAAGAVAGGVWGWHEVGLQEYVSHGLRRTIAYLMDAQVRRGAILGAVLGVWLAVLWAGARGLWEDPVAWLRPRELFWAQRAARRRPSALSFPLVVALVGLGVAVAVRGTLEGIHFVAAALALVTWWLLIGVELAHGRLRRTAHLLAAWASVPLFLLVAERRALFTAIGIERYAGELTLAATAAMFGALALACLAGGGTLPRFARGLVVVAELPLLAAVGLAVCAPFAPRGVEASHPVNVLIVGIDTLRLDHTSLTPHPHADRDLTPRIAALAERGTVFETAVSQAPWTMPAFASIFTGRYPHEHAAISLTGTLRKQELTLAEILREAGYHTGSIVSHYFVNNTHGFGQGYDDFNRDYVLGEYEITSERISDAAIRWLDDRDDDPFFLFLHYFDPHYEYRDHPQSPWADGYEGWVRNEMHIEGLRFKRHLMVPADLDFLRNLYDEEIRYTDEQIGRVLDHLAELDLLGETLVLVVSDHGEEFMERGWLGHSITLSDQVLHVPLVVVPPEGGTAPVPRVRRTVETRSVFATTLDAAGVDWDASVLHRSLLPLATGARADSTDGPEDRAFSTVWTPDALPEWGKRAMLSSLRTSRFKLVRDDIRGSETLYDLEADPMESADASDAHPDELATLRAELDDWLERMNRSLRTIPQRGAVAGEMAARLKALGYL